jgi:hypothetical protein
VRVARRTGSRPEDSVFGSSLKRSVERRVALELCLAFKLVDAGALRSWPELLGGQLDRPLPQTVRDVLAPHLDLGTFDIDPADDDVRVGIVGVVVSDLRPMQLLPEVLRSWWKSRRSTGPSSP